MAQSWLDEVAATHGWLSLEQAELLYETARRMRRGCIVEIGTYRGRSTIALAAGAGEGISVYTFDPHETFRGVMGGDFGPEDRGEFFRTMLRSGYYRTVRLVNLSSEVVAPGWRLPVGLLWIDGDHRYESVRRDVDAWMPHLTPDADIVFDDAANPELGPIRVIEELAVDGWAVMARAGKVTLVRRQSG